MPPRVFTIAAVTTAALVTGTLGAEYLHVPQGSKDSSPAVATVAGVPVTDRDLRIRVSQLLPMASFHGRLSPDAVLAVKRAALDELVAEELICQEAARQGRRPDPAAVEAEVAAVRSRFGSDEEFEAGLRESDVTMGQFRRYMARLVLVRDARAAHVPPPPTDADLREYYDANRSKFVRPERIDLTEILVRVDPAGGAAAEQSARRTTDQLLARLRAGADFGALAWERSDDDYRVKNGEIGWVHRGRLDPDFEAAAFAAPVGELRVARSLSGFHIFRVRSREPERQLAFDETRDALLARVGRDRLDAATRAWDASLRASARVDILDAELRAALPLAIVSSGGLGRTAHDAPAAPPHE